MERLFFESESFDKEIIKKLLSQRVPASFMMESLMSDLRDRGLEDAGLGKLKTLFNQYLSGAAFDREKPHYLSHPIRVTAAYSVLTGKADYETISLGLCHNLKEKMGEDYRKAIPEEFLSAENKDKIDILTIDRDQEKDPRYLKYFYDGIDQVPGLMVLKTIDKLDNTLIWPILNLEPYHAQIVLEQVCPRIRKTEPDLAKYLEELTRYAEARETKEKYEGVESTDSFKRQLKEYEGAKL
jgi:hypothetical protein